MLSCFVFLCGMLQKVGLSRGLCKAGFLLCILSDLFLVSEKKKNSHELIILFGIVFTSFSKS